MSFLTDFTPATPRATWTALSMSAWDRTKPLNWTTPLKVSTLISLTLRSGSLRISAFTFDVITESSTYSPVPSLVAVEPHPQADASTTLTTWLVSVADGTDPGEYTDALQQQINAETGRVHTSFSLTGAQTGRLSSNDPNLQNIPIRTEVGRKIRDAFIADAGHKLLSADYSQIELRLAAHMADVPQLKEAFNAGADIHAITAEELFGTVDRDTRGKAKTVNFAILYGISSWGLAGRLGVPKDEGKAIIDRYFERFPGIRDYIHSTLGFVREHGFTRTLFGRKTHFEPNIRSPNPSIRGGAERAAINAPIQGTSADLIKRAMARMDDALADAGLSGVKMLLQVHDELVFEVPEAKVMTCLKPAREFVERWRKGGGGFELEQFGSGLNSFQTLKHIDADYLKLDRALTNDLAHHSENEQKVRELCSQAHAAGKRTMVEWIEEATSMPMLFSAGVNFAQGNFLAPASAEMRYVT